MKKRIKKYFARITAGFLKFGLKKKTVIFVMLIFGAAVCLSVTAFGILYRNLWRESALKYAESVSLEKKSSVEQYFESLDDLAYKISYSNWMQDVFLKNVSPLRMMEREENAIAFLGSLSTLYGGNQFAVLTLDGRKLGGSVSYKLDYTLDVTKQEWYPDLLKEGKYVQTGTGKGIYQNNKEWSMTIYYVVNDYNTLEMTGFLVITIPLDNLTKLVETEYEGTWLVMQGDDKTIGMDLPREISSDLAHIPEAGMPRMIGKYYILSTALDTEFFQWSLITVSDMSRQKGADPILVVVFIGMLMLTGVMLFVVALATSRYLTSPILKCRDAMREIRNNNIGVTVNNVYRDEIGELIRGFNDMSGSIYSLIEKNRLISALQREAEVKILERQINPHFLFNTLEIINSLILSHRDASAMLMCETLGKLYQYNLKAERWTVLREELAYTEQYLFIMKYKINDLTVVTDVDEELLDLPFLKMILQPVVENSIKHGFERKSEECCISILIHGETENVKIVLMDNGHGMEEEQLEILLSELEMIRKEPTGNQPESNHIGIKNVVQRLALEYGDYFTIRITSNLGLGTRVELKLPLEKREEG